MNGAEGNFLISGINRLHNLHAFWKNHAKLF